MKIEAFEKELQKISPDFTIIKSQKLPSSTVFLCGEPQFALPREDIFDEVQPGYGVETPWGSFQRFRTRTEALDIARGVWQRFRTDSDYADALLGKGKYSDAALK